MRFFTSGTYHSGHFLSILLTVCSLFLAGGAAAEQIGTAVIDGRTIILDRNKTWRYQDEAEKSDGCETVQAIVLCVKPLGWTPTTAPNSGDYAALYVNEQRYYFGVMFQPVGTQDGLSMKMFQTGIIDNAANFIAVKPEQIPVLSRETAVKGMPGANAISYQPELEGTPFIFYNAFKIYRNRSIQYVFWTVGKTITPEFKALIEKTLSQIRDE